MFEIPIEDTIDLHTFQPKDIEAVINEYLHQASQKGLTHLRIIHGKGIGVQRAIVHSILGKHSEVLDFHDLPNRGSTTVTLRTNAS